MTEPGSDSPASQSTRRSGKRPGRSKATSSGSSESAGVVRSATAARIEPRSDHSQWFRIDLHLHTPASLDYQERNVSPVDLLRVAHQKKLDIVAFTDHNSVSGYATLLREIEDLELIERLDRLSTSERALLAEYRTLRQHVLVLPGFEFTATFGFHILAIFPEETSIRKMEFLLMLLHVDESKFGSGEVGSTTDVISTYRILREHGAIVIGAHANSTNGVAMRGVTFGGQTKIAYTQDENLHALELTDLNAPPPKRSSAKTWDGTRPGYPRRMHLIQGSDAHRLTRDEKRLTNLGIGDRPTEVFLPDRSWQSLINLFQGQDFSRVRPAGALSDRGQEVLDIRARGGDADTAFHENLTNRRSGAAPVLADIVALANGAGGTIFLGIGDNPKRPVQGVSDFETTAKALNLLVQESIDPAPVLDTRPLQIRGKSVTEVSVLAGTEKPYVLNPGGIFVREGNETRPATREEIVSLSAAGVAGSVSAPSSNQRPETATKRESGRRNDRSKASDKSSTNGKTDQGLDSSERIPPPSGVEITAVTGENGARNYTMRDLRSGEETSEVSLDTARGLWRYAIQQHQGKALLPGHVKWRGDRGYWKGFRHRNGEPRHNLIYREGNDLRIFYGVSEEGLTDVWRAVLPAAKPRTTISSEDPAC